MEYLKLTRRNKKQQSIEDGQQGRLLQRYGRRGALILLAVMLVFTFLSRVTASVTIAKVTTELPAARKIIHNVQAEGMVEKNRELAVMIQPDILVKTVYATEGRKVQEGDLLAELDLDDLKERIAQIENEIQVLKLQNQAESSNAALSAQTKQKQINRAQEDYNRTVQENDTAVADAASALQAAKDSLTEFENAQTGNAGSDNSEKESGENPGTDGSGESSQDENTGDSSSDTDSQKQESLSAAIAAAEAAYNNAIKAREAAILDAARRLEDAKAADGTNNTIPINNISIEDKEKQIEKLNALLQQEGKVTANYAGVVTNIYLMTGQKTSSTAAFTMADLSSGMRFVAQIQKEDAKYVSVGDAVKLSTIGKEVSGLTVDTLEVNEDGQTLTVTVMLTSDELSIGDTATLQVEKQSEQFGTTVPLTAVHEENGKNYIYILTEVNTVLGGQFAVQRVDVEIADKNGQYAALKSSALSSEDQVIVDSDRHITAGDRVRLQEQ